MIRGEKWSESPLKGIGHPPINKPGGYSSGVNITLQVPGVCSGPSFLGPVPMFWTMFLASYKPQVLSRAFLEERNPHEKKGGPLRKKQAGGLAIDGGALEFAS